MLVNNAGVFLAHPPLTTSYDEWQAAWSQTLATNLGGAGNATFCAMPHLMAARRRGGRQRVEPGRVPRRAGLPGLRRVQGRAERLRAVDGARRWRRTGSPSGRWRPGFVQTEMAREVLDGPGGDAVRAQSPFGRVARPEEVAAAVLWLASPEARFSTGTIIDVNGASYLRS